MSINKVMLSGNLGADAELRYTRGGKPVALFSLAVNERVPAGDGTWGEHTSWIDCVMFGKRAEALSTWLRKGTKISLTGHLRTSTYLRDDQTVKRWEVRVDDVELMQYRRGQQAPAQGMAPEAQAQAPAPDQYDEDVPF